MEALGSKTTMKLLNALLDDPLKEFKEIELVNAAKTGKGSAGISVDNLVKENILAERRAGKAKILSLNLQNKYTILLKSLRDKHKFDSLPDSKQASLLLFMDKAKEKSDLILVFGSSIAGTATENSDIDILIVTKNINKIDDERKNVEKLFGERLNIHIYDKDEIKNKIISDMFVRNALLKGALLHGYDLGIQLFSGMKRKKDLERLYFLNDRIKAALRNYLNKDYKASEDILGKTTEQLMFYLLSDNDVSYASKKDAAASIKKSEFGSIFQKIIKASLKIKIELTEKLILDVLKHKILENHGYGRRDQK